jgi:hypothetical protein
MTDIQRKDEIKPQTYHIDQVDSRNDNDVDPKVIPVRHQQEHGELYDEALERYGERGELDPAAEKKLLR